MPDGAVALILIVVLLALVGVQGQIISGLRRKLHDAEQRAEDLNQALGAWSGGKAGRDG